MREIESTHACSCTGVGRPLGPSGRRGRRRQRARAARPGSCLPPP
jgi:hypothetical protein